MRLNKQTPVGIMLARYGDSPDRPGLLIDLWKKAPVTNQDLSTQQDRLVQSLVKVEYDPTKGCIQILVYGDRDSEEPTSVTDVCVEMDEKEYFTNRRKNHEAALRSGVSKSARSSQPAACRSKPHLSLKGPQKTQRRKVVR